MLYFFFFNDPATTEIYTLSLHDALPIFALQDGQYVLLKNRRSGRRCVRSGSGDRREREQCEENELSCGHTASRCDRKSTRLNSSHANTSYTVFCLIKNIETYRPRRLITN